jgi:hypothetical protein
VRTERFPELIFKVPRVNADAGLRFDVKRLDHVAEAFERKLVGVAVRRGVTDDGMACLIVTVRGGSDQDYLLRLWHRHLREHGLPIDDTSTVLA